MTWLTISRVPNLALIAGVLSVLVACGDGPTSPTGNANLVVNLTDDHTQNVTAVNLFFTSVTANPKDGAPEILMLELTEAQDLLALQDMVIALATGVVGPGDYASVTINLDQDNSNILLNTGEVVPLRIPSEEIKVLGGFTVTEEGLTTVTLDFVAEESLVHLGNDEWLLQPVILMDVSTS